MAGLFDPLAAPFTLEGTNGEAVVMVHGFTGVPAHWRLLAPVVHRAGFTVRVPLLAGHGTSIEDLAQTDASDWLASVVDELSAVADHARVHLVGLSMGGLLSLVVASNRRVASVTTINSPVRYRNRQTYLAPVLHWIRPRVDWPDGEDPDLPPEAEPLWLTYPGFPTRQLGHMVALARRARRAARRVDSPALVVQSKTDETVEPSSGRIIAGALAGPVRLVWLERSIHNALLGSERATVEREVLRHLRNV